MANPLRASRHRLIQASEGRELGLSLRLSGQPAQQTHNIDDCGRHQMREMCFCRRRACSRCCRPGSGLPAIWPTSVSPSCTGMAWARPRAASRAARTDRQQMWPTTVRSPADAFGSNTRLGGYAAIAVCRRRIAIIDAITPGGCGRWPGWSTANLPHVSLPDRSTGKGRSSPLPYSECYLLTVWRYTSRACPLVSQRPATAARAYEWTVSTAITAGTAVDSQPYRCSCISRAKATLRRPHSRITSRTSRLGLGRPATVG